MYERLEECPLCKHSVFQNHIICDDHSVSQESFALVKCQRCELIFTNPRPKEEHLHQYYDSSDYISHTDKANNLVNLLYKIVRKYTLKQKLKLVKRYSEHSTLLDFGCGTGDFIELCTRNNWQAFGYEPDSKAAAIAETKNGSNILRSLKELNQPVEIITAWHVLEHVHNLNKTLKTLLKKLKDGGHLILALPNHLSYDASYYKEYWAAYDVPRHLYHFDIQSMKILAAKHKLKLVETRPMNFDSYYVSMLSEKYKQQKGILNALKVGFQSNKRASKNNQYSSLIYILRK